MLSCIGGVSGREDFLGRKSLLPRIAPLPLPYRNNLFNQSALRNLILKFWGKSWIKAKYADFQPEGLADWEAEQSEDRIDEADAQLKALVSEMRDYIFSVFRSIYGDKNNAYWEKGVTDSAVKTGAYKISQDYPLEDRLPLETYLEVVEMKKIIENKKVWPLFKSVFDIPEFGEKGQAKNLKWMLRINELRRIPGHPAKERKYKLDDFEYIDYIHGEFMARLARAKKEPTPELVLATGEDDD